MWRSRYRRIVAIRFASGAMPEGSNTAQTRARGACHESGLPTRADVPVGRLSHGEHRQLEIAMALAANPRLLLLDEPMAGMGPEESAAMLNLLRELKGGTDHCFGRTRHGCGICVGGSHHCHGLRPDHRLGRAGGDSGTIPRCAAPIWANVKTLPRESRCRSSAARTCGVETSYGLSRVLFGISLGVAAGEMVSLMGRNGMGKTTTVRSIMGLTAPAAGSIRLSGTELRGLPAYRIAKLGIGLVPEGRQVFPNLTARENLLRDGGQSQQCRRSLDRRKNLRAVSSTGGARRRHGQSACPAASSRCWPSAAR